MTYMKNRIAVIAALAACLIAVYACGRATGSDPVLLRAEQLMEQHPDSALLLDSMQPSSLSKEDQAEWYLLIAEAKDKKHIPPTTDSLLLIACDYYETHHDQERLMKAYFYTGKVNQVLGDAPKAQAYYQKALSIGESSDNAKMKARINSYIGLLYAQQLAYSIALPYLQESLHCLALAKDTVSQSIVYRDIARTYHAMHTADSAEIYYRKALEINNPQNHPFVLGELSDEKKYCRGVFYYFETRLKSSKQVYCHFNFANRNDLAALEMMLNELPVIVNNTTGLKEIVDKVTYGDIVDISDGQSAEILKNAINGRLEKYTNDNIIKTIRDKICKNYSIHIFQKG